MGNLIRGVAAALGLILAAVLMPGCEAAVSDESYDQITVGMTFDQVKNILGEGTKEDVSGVTISSGGIAGGSANTPTTKTYSWKSGGKQIIIEFKDEKVLNKRKAGF
jgi:hypothetical protein